MANLKMVSPWINYYHELQAFFKYDHDVTVLLDEDETEVRLYVNGEEKADALTQLLPDSRKYGNVTLKITVIPANSKNLHYGRPLYVRDAYNHTGEISATEILFRTALRGNEAYVFSDSVNLQTNELIYVVFRNEVVQYYNDDLGDYYGQCSTLFQNLAEDIFNQLNGVHYCTDKPGYRE